MHCSMPYHIVNSRTCHLGKFKNLASTNKESGKLLDHLFTMRSLICKTIVLNIREGVGVLLCSNLYKPVMQSHAIVNLSPSSVKWSHNIKFLKDGYITSTFGNGVATL